MQDSKCVCVHTKKVNNEIASHHLKLLINILCTRYRFVKISKSSSRSRSKSATTLNEQNANNNNAQRWLWQSIVNETKWQQPKSKKVATVCFPTPCCPTRMQRWWPVAPSFIYLHTYTHSYLHTYVYVQARKRLQRVRQVVMVVVVPSTSCLTWHLPIRWRRCGSAEARTSWEVWMLSDLSCCAIHLVDINCCWDIFLKWYKLY